MTTINTLLTETEKVLNKDGWRRGSFGNSSKGRDLVGALATASGRIGGVEVIASARDQLRKATGDDNLVHWNDHTAVNLADVTRILRAART